MRIRGTSHPKCKLCAFAAEKDGKINCTKTGDKKEQNDFCSGFRYDIFKYEPADRLDFGKFSKEDFEI